MSLCPFLHVTLSLHSSPHSVLLHIRYHKLPHKHTGSSANYMLYVFVHEDTTYFSAMLLEPGKENLQKFNIKQIIR